MSSWNMNPGPKAVPVQVTPEDERKIAGMSSEVEILEYMHQLSEEQGLASRDPWTKELLAVPAAAPAAKTAVVKVGGTEYEISYETQEQLVAAELELFRELQSPKTTQQEQPPVPQARAENGQFISAEQQAANAELELRFKRGEISTDQYLTESGAIERHLDALGIDVASLREVSGRGFQQSWAAAADSYLHSGEGASWPGGEENMKVIGEILTANNLMDAEDKQAAIVAAAKFARENGLLIANPATEAANAISSLERFEDIREMAHRASGFFGR